MAATLPRLFAAQAARTADAVAVVWGTDRLTYGELDRRANRLARHLRALGVAPETRVAVWLERSPAMVTAILAVLKAGGAYVPLDPAYPSARTAAILDDAGAAVVVTGTKVAAGLPATAAAVVDVDRDAPQVAAAGDADPVTGAGPENLAYLIYTSGSTGLPKGVAIEHRSVANLVQWASSWFSAAELAGMLASTSISFDLSVFELFAPLSSGGKVILAATALELPRLPAASEVTFVNTVPSVAAELVRAAPLPESVRAVGLAGEPLRRELVRRIHAQRRDARVVNLYAPSETTTYSTVAPIAAAADDEPAIGRPIAHTRARVLDRAMRPVEAGETGELYLGGAGLARGYLNRPRETAAAFLPDPFNGAAGRPGARLYRTGDVARRRPAGDLDFLGRADHQVKIRGFRVELGEVEAALGRHPALRAVAVTAREDRAGDRYLAAYVVPEPGSSPTVSELRGHLAPLLPVYMLPRTFVDLEAMPLTPSGKVDRRALPEPGRARPAMAAAFVPPRGPVEAAVAAIWAEVLGRERVGAEDHLFDLGGDSLSASRVLSRLRDTLGVELSAATPFERPTVAALAAAVETARRGAEVPPPRPVPRDGPDGLALSFAEQRMWLLSQYQPGGSAYTIPLAIRLRGRLDAAALARSLAEIARRHESLRTVFPAVDGRPCRRIAAPGTWTLPRTDLAGLAGDDRDGALWRLLGSELRRPFDLARGPLWRAGLLRLGEEDHVLWLAAHHAVADGWSLEVLIDEAGELYNAFASGRPSPLSPLPLQYADYACWQRRWLGGDVLREHLEYWRRQLGENPPPLALPTDRPRPPTPTFAGRRMHFELTRPLSEALLALGREAGATPHLTLLAVFQALLSRYAGQERFTVGLPVAGRNRAELEGLIGLFVNTLVLSADLTGDPDFRQLLARVRRGTLAAYDHQEIPFDRLVETLQKERDPSRHPLFQVMFDFQRSALEKLRLRDLSATLLEFETPTAMFELTLVIMEEAGVLRGVVEYATDLFDAATIQRLISCFKELLEEVVAEPGKPLSQLTFARRVERDPLVAAARRAAAPPAAGDQETRETALAQRQEELSERRAGLSAQRRALLEKWTRRKAADRPATARGLPRRPADAPAELSFSQQRLWFIDQLEPGSPRYNIPLAVRLEGRLAVTALERSLNEIVRRHETLRTTFSAAEGRPFQVIAPVLAVPLPLVDLAGLPAAERRREALRRTREEAQRPFDLEHGPVIRALLLRLGDDEHVLPVTLHHICSDAWSMAIFVRETRALYQAFTAAETASGPRAGLAELPIQYADFAHWQKRHLSGETLESLLGYWRRQLAGSPAALELPTDRRRPPQVSSRGANHAFVFPDRLAAGLEQLGQQQRGTLFMTLLTAFAILLTRHGGQRDLVVGSPIAGRNRSELEGLIGFFVNTLALRVDLSAPAARELTVRQALARVTEVALGAYAHQDLPFEKLLEELQPERQRSRTPLFQVVFAFENVPPEVLEPADPELGGITLRPVDTDSGTAKFDLTLIMRREPRGLAGCFEYARDLFDGTTVARLTRHFATLLESMVAHPEGPITGLELLTAAERHQLRREWTATATPYPRQASIHELFELQARRTPDAVALVEGGGPRQLSYRELDRRANRLAHHLRRRGLGAEGLVALAIERSPEMVVGILGVLKAGGAYLPLDLGSPPGRLARLLEETRPPVVLTQAAVAGSLPRTAPLFCPDADWEAVAGEPDTSPGVAVAAERLGYVMVTSGTTGRPKGVAVPHRAVVRLVRETGYARLTDGEVFLQLAPVSFDASTLELWGALANGGRLVLFPGRLTSPEELGETLARHRVSTLWLTAGLFHQMVEARPRSLAPLTRLLAGGDVLSVAHVRKILGEMDGTLINGYGPTENTTFTCCYRMRPAAPVGSPVPIGRPIANTRIHLLDRRLEPVPIGVAGMLYAGGDGLARGYFARPARTAESFVPDPSGGAPGGRLYCTGDLARYLADGNVEFLGRRDTQVKVRGFRIELGEIEAVLGRHPAVAVAAVVAREDTPGDKRLVAYLVAAGDGEPTAGELRDYLRKTLPEYMVPAVFVELDALPLNANGKVDRRALPAPDGARPAPEASFVAPRDAVEDVLAGIWKEALRLDSVGVEDDFFELGGHSLLATQLISRIRKAFRVELPVASLFEATTVAAMARLLMANEPRPGQTEKIARALLKVRAMSAEDVRRTLAQKRGEAAADG